MFPKAEARCSVSTLVQGELCAICFYTWEMFSPGESTEFPGAIWPYYPIIACFFVLPLGAGSSTDPYAHEGL
jgi:hypothetical protein